MNYEQTNEWMKLTNEGAKEQVNVVYIPSDIIQTVTLAFTNPLQ